MFLCPSGCGCDSYQHVTRWQNSFFINDSTLGIVGWAYDEKEGTNIAAGEISTATKNFEQKLYRYSINTGELSLVTILKSGGSGTNCGFYNGVRFTPPWLVYSSHGSDNEIGVYNLSTGEMDVMQGDEALYISQTGRYVIFDESGSSVVFDRIEKQQVCSRVDAEFFYVDEDSARALGVVGDRRVRFRWTCLMDFNSDHIETIRSIYDTIGFELFHDEPPVFVIYSGEFLYRNRDDTSTTARYQLLSTTPNGYLYGTFPGTKIANIPYGNDYSLSTSRCTGNDAGVIFIRNYKTDESTALLRGQRN